MTTDTRDQSKILRLSDNAVVSKPGAGQSTPIEAAACLMAILQREGAVFTINADGFSTWISIPFGSFCGNCGPHDMIRIVLALTDEFKQLMGAENVIH